VSFPAVAWASQQGAYHLGAIADPYNNVPELIESNNSSAGYLLGVGWAPDLVVTSVSGPPSAQPGGSFMATATVCNQGTQSSPGTYLELHLSSDSTITEDDPYAGYAWVAPLNTGDCATVTVPANANVPQPGTYNLGALVDPYNGVQELIETNNTSSGVTINVN
jgi:subtilase family serine protease